MSASAQSSSVIRLTWTASTGATLYKIFRSASATGSFDSVATSTGTSFDNQDLSPNTTYFYKVSAHNSAGGSAQSSAVSAKTLIAPPATPAGVAAAGVSASAIQVSWNKIAGADSFYVYRNTSATGTFTAIGKSVDTLYRDSSLSANTTFFYKVAAKNAGGLSEISAAASGTTWPPIPGVPGNLSATTVDSTKINLTWTASTGTVSYYAIYRSRHTDSTTFDSLASVPSGTTYQAVGLTPGTKYFFRVKAVNQTGASADATASAITMQRAHQLNISSAGTGIGNVSISPQKNLYTHGDTVRIIANPAASSAFAGWSGDTTNSSNSIRITMNGPKNITANFSMRYYIVKFDSRGGSPVDSQRIRHDSIATEPPAPIYPGHAFSGWYTTSSLTAAFDFVTPITVNRILYAKWTPVYRVTYHANGGTGTVPIDNNQYQNGQTVTVASGSGLSRTNHTFSGWNTQEDTLGTNYQAGQSFNIGSTNVILYAKWIMMPSITTQPKAQSGYTRKSATFNVVATGPSLTYQWQRNGAPVSGATAASYTINHLQMADTGMYRCVVTNTAGSVTSNAAKLSIYNTAGMNEIPAGNLPKGLITHTIGSFHMDTTEVTEEQFSAVMSFRPSSPVGPTHPMTGITWYDAVLYCNARTKASGSTDTVYSYSRMVKSSNSWQSNNCVLLENLSIHLDRKGYRLPSPIEWEYAYRAGTTSTFYWGSSTDDSVVENYAWYMKSNEWSSSGWQPVGKKKPNNFGLYDMAGNVWELVNLYDPASGTDMMGGGHESRVENLAPKPTTAGSLPADDAYEHGFRVKLPVQ